MLSGAGEHKATGQQSGVTETADRRAVVQAPANDTVVQPADSKRVIQSADDNAVMQSAQSATDGHLGTISAPLAKLILEYVDIMDLERISFLDNPIYKRAVLNIYNQSIEIYFRFLAKHNAMELMIAVLKFLNEKIKWDERKDAPKKEKGLSLREQINFGMEKNLIDATQSLALVPDGYRQFMSQMLNGYYRDRHEYGERQLRREIKQLMDVKMDPIERAFLSIDEISTLNTDQPFTAQLLQSMIRLMYLYPGDSSSHLHPSNPNRDGLKELGEFAGKTNLALVELIANTVGYIQFNQYDNLLVQFFENKNLARFKRALATNGGKLILKACSDLIVKMVTNDRNIEFLEATLKIYPEFANMLTAGKNSILMLAINKKAFIIAHLLLSFGADPIISNPSYNADSLLQQFLHDYKNPEIWELLITFLKAGTLAGGRPFLDYVNLSEKDGLFMKLKQLPNFQEIYSNYLQWVLNNPTISKEEWTYPKLIKLHNLSRASNSEDKFLKQTLQLAAGNVTMTSGLVITFSQLFSQSNLCIPFAEMIFERMTAYMLDSFQNVDCGLLDSTKKVAESKLSLLERCKQYQHLFECRKQDLEVIIEIQSSSNNKGFFQSKPRKIELTPAQIQLAKVSHQKTFWETKIKIISQAIDMMKAISQPLSKHATHAPMGLTDRRPTI